MSSSTISEIYLGPMTNIMLNISSPYFLLIDNGKTSPEDSQPLLAGNYLVVADGMVQVSDKIAVIQTESLDTGTRVQDSKKQVRQRDKAR
ncbi:hypothetical protein GGR50DRAFT_647762 [Xylaria sp. CBS 124048]|nr:hypothetical protein GGR50DRAFT_647762 [Xylaria sp. CBS 124048]